MPLFMPWVWKKDMHRVQRVWCQTLRKYIDSIFRIHPDVLYVFGQHLREQVPDTRTMYIYANKLRRGVRLSHFYQAIAHAEANLYDATAGFAKLKVPVKHPALNQQAERGETLIPAALLPGRNPARPYYKTANTRCYWNIRQTHGR